MSESNVFGLLAKPLRRLIAERGFDVPTEPQSEAIPVILEGRNLLLIAPSGTGKTEAALLPVLHFLLSTPRGGGMKAVYITPLRALNRDLLERVEWWCGELDFKVAVRHGDTALEERRAQSLSPPDIMVTTPETLQILLVGRRLNRYLRTVRWVIVDEVHELADNKRGCQLTLSLERLREAMREGFQLIGLSATIGSPEEVARFLVGVGRKCEVRDVSVAKKVEAAVHYPLPSRIDESLAAQLYTYPSVAARLRHMRGLIEEHQSTLLFTNTRPTAEVLANRFRIWDPGFPVRAHHGSLSGPSRLRTEQDMKLGRVKAIICTSSLELGIDVGVIDFCIQYGSPREVTRFIQRVGRSGHGVEETARGVIIALNPDDALESIVIKARAQRRILEEVRIPLKPYDILMHDLMAMTIMSREWSIDEAFERVRRAYPFRDLGREEVDGLVRYMRSLGLVSLDRDENIASRPPGYKRIFSYYFKNLSMIPRTRQYLVVDDEDGLPIGILDEEFVVEYGEPGTKFVIGGYVWTIIQVFRDKVYVRGDEDPIGAIPSWMGEEIPVPLSIAQEVGRIRGRVEEWAERGWGLDKIAGELSGKYQVEEEAVKEAVKATFTHHKRGLPVPTDRRVVIEKFEDLTVIHAHFGTLVNRTLSLLLVHEASSRMGEASEISVDPYRVILRSEALEPEEVSDMVRRLTVDGDAEAREVVEDSRFFRGRIVQVARRMGVLEEEVEVTSQVVDRLIKGLRETPAFTEAFKEVVHKDLCLEETLTILRRVREGEVEVASAGLLSEASPIAEGAVKRYERTTSPATPDRLRLLALASAKARLLSTISTFACTECKEYVEEVEVGMLEEHPRCPRCGSHSLGMAEEPADRVRRSLRSTRGGVGRSRLLARIRGTARLISRYGKAAAVALAAQGVTVRLAEEVLKRGEWPTRRFYESLLEEERRKLARRFRRP